MDANDKFVAVQQQLDMFAQDQHNLNAHVGNLTREYNNVLSEVTYLHRLGSHQSHIIQYLIQYISNAEKKSTGLPDVDASHLLSPDVQQMMSIFNEIARMAPPEPMQDPFNRSTFVSGRLLPGGRSFIPMPSDLLQPGSPIQRTATTGSDSSSPSVATPTISQVPIMLRSSSALFGGLSSADHPTLSAAPSFISAPPNVISSAIVPRPPAKPRQQKSAPAWSIRPKVLLVEDDAVCRKLSSKFLELFGCTLDMAEDGVSAVSKMNTEKYDLVFMVRFI